MSAFAPQAPQGRPSEISQESTSRDGPTLNLSAKGVGVSRFGQHLPQAMPLRRLRSSLSAQDGAIFSICDGMHPTARGALDLQQAFMKLIGQNGIKDMVFPFAIDLQILSGQALFLKANALQQSTRTKIGGDAGRLHAV